MYSCAALQQLEEARSRASIVCSFVAAPKAAEVRSGRKDKKGPAQQEQVPKSPMRCPLRSVEAENSMRSFGGTFLLKPSGARHV
eukprot:Skav205676  [mRNA]  locus=scaffold458:755621:756233:+ [translate_table: standard]